jgi:murein L,D-transpeptidase YcbB/YkuD
MSLANSVNGTLILSRTCDSQGRPRQLYLVNPISVVIFYATATVDSEGRPRFATDIYGRAPRLEQDLEACHPQIVSATGRPPQ